MIPDRMNGLNSNTENNFFAGNVSEDFFGNVSEDKPAQVIPTEIPVKSQSLIRPLTSTENKTIGFFNGFGVNGAVMVATTPKINASDLTSLFAVSINKVDNTFSVSPDTIDHLNISYEISTGKKLDLDQPMLFVLSHDDGSSESLTGRVREMTKEESEEVEAYVKRIFAEYYPPIVDPKEHHHDIDANEEISVSTKPTFTASLYDDPTAKKINKKVNGNIMEFIKVVMAATKLSILSEKISESIKEMKAIEREKMEERDEQGIIERANATLENIDNVEDNMLDKEQNAVENMKEEGLPVDNRQDMIVPRKRIAASVKRGSTTIR